ncbi:MAG: ATP-binding protein [Acidimicrobiales bacterium]
MDRTRVTVQLQPIAKSVGEARRAVADHLKGCGLFEHAQDAVLLTSEVVTNAVVHAGPHARGETLCLVIERTADAVRVEVSDGGPSLPTTQGAAVDESTGRGLLLLDALATRWGIVPRDAGKIVWFEVSCLDAREKP